MKALCVSVNKATLAYLREGGIPVETTEVDDAEELLGWISDGLYQVLVVDLDHSGLGNFFPRAIRKEGNKIPILGIGAGRDGSAWSDVRADFLEYGGDDLIRAPGNPRELVASIRATTRRFVGGMIDILSFNGVTEYGEVLLKINLVGKQISINNQPLHLTGQETILMLTLASNHGRILSKEAILSCLYTNEVDEAEIKIVDVFVCKIRKKLADAHPGAGAFIETIWGRGYTLSSTFQMKHQQVG